MSWSKESTTKLIEMWECHDCLWNMHIDDYRNKIKRENSIAEIAEACDKTSKQVKDKLHSLRSQMSDK